VYYGNLHQIEESIERQMICYYQTLSRYDWRVYLAYNGEAPEKTIDLVIKLRERFPRLFYSYSAQAGKGSGVLNTLSESDADIMIYMDIDLASDIKDVVNLIRGIEEGNDVCQGSRYHEDSIVSRSFKRKFISIGYNRYFMPLMLGAKAYKDAQCGFKAVNRKVVKEVFPLIKNRNWFFDSEMLYFAQRKGMKIKEIPITWTESQFSGVKLIKAIWEFIKCSFELRFRKI
jgi:hypothetical protein